jgi:glycosyltransferase involved in cell wall biosynthesis
VVTSPYEKSDIQSRTFLEHREIEGIHLRIIRAADSNRLSFVRRTFRVLLFATCATGYSLFLSYDVIICSSGPITVGVPGILARWVRGKKFVFEVRDLWPAGGIEMGKIKSRWQIRCALLFEKLCYSSANLVVAASRGQQDHILARYPTLRTAVIPNASDTDLFGTSRGFETPTWLAGKKLFTHIGSLGFIHHVDLILDSASELKRKGREDIIIVLIGEGVERKELEDRKENERLDNVVFLGLLPKTALPPWVQNSLATLFTTLHNPVQNASSPNKVFDSFAAGTPVIQTTTGWLFDLFSRERCGVNVPPDDAEALADAMLLLADYENLRRELAANAMRLAYTEFDRDRLAADYLTALQVV